MPYASGKTPGVSDKAPVKPYPDIFTLFRDARERFGLNFDTWHNKGDITKEQTSVKQLV